MAIEIMKKVDLDVLSDKFRVWFINNNWDIENETRGHNSYTICAKKTGDLRKVMAMVRALNVTCIYEKGKTKVCISLGKTGNLLTNMAWFVCTGGTNLAFTAWSLELKRKFTNYARRVLEEV